MRQFLDQKSGPNPLVVEKIGGEMREAGVSLVNFARLHEHVIVMDILPECPIRKRAALIRHAGNFFAATITAAWPMEESARNSSRLTKTIESLSGRTVELAAANRQLDLEITRRGKVEMALRKSERDCSKSLEESETLTERLHGLSSRILSVQEEERKKISRELHDVIAQALLGINVSLATLRKQSGNTSGLDRDISATQKMVAKSARTVQQFAHALHPSTLIDLGLIPALHSLMKSFTTRTGVHTHLTVFEGIEKLHTMKRTVLYRVVQEALDNVARHAHASQVEVSIRKEADFVCMEVSDDGRSFEIRALEARGSKRLGLLGMRERVELVGGCFEIKPAPGKGTKVIAHIPVSKATQNTWLKAAVEKPPEQP